MLTSWVDLTKQQIADKIFAGDLDDYTSLTDLLNDLHFKGCYFISNKNNRLGAVFTPERMVEFNDQYDLFKEGLVTLDELYNFLHSFKNFGSTLPKFSKPTIVLFDDEAIEISSWKFFLIELCIKLNQKNPKVFDKILDTTPGFAEKGLLGLMIKEGVYLVSGNTPTSSILLSAKILHDFNEITGKKFNVYVSNYEGGK